jgi:hypothetical protein
LKEVLRSVFYPYEVGNSYRKGIDWEFNKDYSEPSTYDILSVLQKYPVGTFEDFCSDYGYDTDSRKAEKIYLAVKEEYPNIAMLFSDSELEEMQEIQ